MFRPLLLVAFVLQLLPVQGWGAVTVCADPACEVRDEAVAESESCCTNDCCCGEACPCVEPDEPDTPPTPTAPAERRCHRESPESPPRMVVRTSPPKLPEPREVALLSHDLQSQAPALPWGRSVQISFGVWTP